MMLLLMLVVLDCEVTAVGTHSATVVCEDTTLTRIPLTEWSAIEMWKKQVPVEGLRLKAARGADGMLHSVADCETRIREAVEEYCGGEYCRPPINSLTPEDCH